MSQRTQGLAETSTAITHGIRIVVRSESLPDQSLPAFNRYAFSYSVRIRNEGRASVQLLARHWVISDCLGNVEEVRGAGVVGEQPILHPGQAYEYTSSAVLRAPRGEMRGSYQMHSVLGRTFNAVIAPFLLLVPYSIN